MFMRLSRYPVTGDLSGHKSLSLSFIKAVKKQWNWGVISQNPNFSWHWVREFPNEAWNWSLLSKSPHFIWKWVEEFPEKEWDWNFLSGKVEHVSTVHAYKEKPWNWLILTLKEDIPVDDILRYPDFPWAVNYLFFTRVTDFEIPFLRHFKDSYDAIAWKDHTKHTSWEVIRKNMDLPWIFNDVSPSDFTREDIPILEHYRDVWDWKILSRCVSFYIIHETHALGLPWDHEEISKNPTVDLFTVRKYDWVKWNLNHVSLDEEIHLWNSSQTIKRYWKRCATNPSYNMCKKLVMREIESILCYERDVRESNKCKEIDDTRSE
jgi:hypothetical protein